uniref:Uncharacterized protein n=1 Tax=Tanacetum cinerariifolium TaxID=118510 RepID=A0A6L2N4V5_TANCI|nr:hypothetical protein [Tanacetum cinerariifolium]
MKSDSNTGSDEQMKSGSTTDSDNKMTSDSNTTDTEEKKDTVPELKSAEAVKGRKRDDEPDKDGAGAAAGSRATRSSPRTRMVNPV